MMAAIQSGPSSAAAPPKSILKKTTQSQRASGSLFPSSKKDKRKIKHELLLSRIAKSTNPKVRKRRPHKKLVTSLDALADALPDTAESGTDGQSSRSQIGDQFNIIKRNSVKSKPGALKRREKLDKNERDRFARNMAQMSVVDSGNGKHDSDLLSTPRLAEDRLKALRSFIAQTMEKRTDMVT